VLEGHVEEGKLMGVTEISSDGGGDAEDGGRAGG
jgi:hypothetical protein